MLFDDGISKFEDCTSGDYKKVNKEENVTTKSRRTPLSSWDTYSDSALLDCSADGLDCGMYEEMDIADCGLLKGGSSDREVYELLGL